MRFTLLAFVCFLFLNAPLNHAQNASHTFQYDSTGFLLDGKPFQIWSGEMHFQRIPRLYWRDRLLKAKALGLNTVATYVFWNALEPQHGKWNFQEQNDLAAFIREAKSVGLYVIVRPGPYACAEWDFGGLPAWLLAKPGIKIRSTDPAFLQPALNYLHQISEIILPLQITQGGNIIMVQVENEYGSYGKDAPYLLALRDFWLSEGVKVPLSTSDGASKDMLSNGSIPGCVVGLDPGANANDFATSKKYRPDVPAFCAEYYPGWLTHWGENWARADTVELINDLKWLIDHKKSWNLYVLHGGTNFDFYAGANFSDVYQPDITSYDYDAPIREDGSLTPKYYAIRRLLARSLQQELPPLPKPAFKMALGAITMRPIGSIFDHLPAPVVSEQPKTMEQLGQNFGFVLYRTQIQTRKGGKLEIPELHDYATVYLNKKYVGRLDRSKKQFELDLPADSATQQLDILVEGMGRINYGRNMTDPKGVVGSVKYLGAPVSDWEHFSLPFDAAYLKELPTSAVTNDSLPQPGRFFSGSFYMASLADTYLDLSDWEKGVIWVNGHNLGRYWNRGPQQHVYLPGAFMHKGENQVLIFDLHKKQAGALKGTLSLE
jgi:beta-galactosidase GanA